MATNVKIGTLHVKLTADVKTFNQRISIAIANIGRFKKAFQGFTKAKLINTTFKQIDKSVKKVDNSIRLYTRNAKKAAVVNPFLGLQKGLIKGLAGGRLLFRSFERFDPGGSLRRGFESGAFRGGILESIFSIFRDIPRTIARTVFEVGRNIATGIFKGFINGFSVARGDILAVFKNFFTILRTILVPGFPAIFRFLVASGALIGRSLWRGLLGTIGLLKGVFGKIFTFFKAPRSTIRNLIRSGSVAAKSYWKAFIATFKIYAAKAGRLFLFFLRHPILAIRRMYAAGISAAQAFWAGYKTGYNADLGVVSLATQQFFYRIIKYGRRLKTIGKLYADNFRNGLAKLSFTGFLKRLSIGFIGPLTRLWGMISPIFSSVFNRLRPLGQKFRSIGVRLGSAIVGGLSNFGPYVWKTITSIFGAIPGGIKTLFSGIGRLFSHSFWSNIGQGFRRSGGRIIGLFRGINKQWFKAGLLSIARFGLGLVKGFKNVFGLLRRPFGSLITRFRGLFSSIGKTPGQFIKNLFLGAKKLVMGFWNGLKNGFKVVWKGIVNIGKGIVKIFNNVMSSGFGTIAKSLGGIITGAVKTAFKVVSGVVLGFGFGLIRAVLSIFVGLANAIGSIFTSLTNLVFGVLGGLLRVVVDIFKSLAQTVVDIIKGLVSSVVNLFSNLFKSLTNIVRTGIRTIKIAFFGLAAAIGFSLKKFADFEQGIYKVFSLLPDVTGEVQRLKDEALAVGRILPQTFEDLNTAFFDVVSSGFRDVGSRMEVLSSSAKLAIAGFAELGTSTSAIITLLKGYNLAAEQAAAAADKLFEAQVYGRTTVQQLASSLGNVVGTAGLVGLSMDELLAAMATVTRQIPQTDRVATAFNRALTAFIKPAAQAQKVLDKWGITLTRVGADGKSILRPLTDIIPQLSRLDIQQLRIVSGSVRSFRAIAALIKLYSTYEFILKRVENASGLVEDRFRRVQKTVTISFRLLLNALRLAGMAMAEFAAPMVVKFLHSLRQAFLDLEQLLRSPVFKKNIELFKLILAPSIQVVRDRVNSLIGRLGDLGRTDLTQTAFGLSWRELAQRITDFTHRILLIPSFVENAFKIAFTYIKSAMIVLGEFGDAIKRIFARRKKGEVKFDVGGAEDVFEDLFDRLEGFEFDIGKVVGNLFDVLREGFRRSVDFFWKSMLSGLPLLLKGLLAVFNLLAARLKTNIYGIPIGIKSKEEFEAERNITRARGNIAKGQLSEFRRALEQARKEPGEGFDFGELSDDLFGIGKGGIIDKKFRGATATIEDAAEEYKKASERTAEAVKLANKYNPFEALGEAISDYGKQLIIQSEESFKGFGDFVKQKIDIPVLNVVIDELNRFWDNLKRNDKLKEYADTIDELKGVTKELIESWREGAVGAVKDPVQQLLDRINNIKPENISEAIAEIIEKIKPIRRDVRGLRKDPTGRIIDDVLRGVKDAADPKAIEAFFGDQSKLLEKLNEVRAKIEEKFIKRGNLPRGAAIADKIGLTAGAGLDPDRIKEILEAGFIQVGNRRQKLSNTERRDLKELLKIVEATKATKKGQELVKDVQSQIKDNLDGILEKANALYDIKQINIETRDLISNLLSVTRDLLEKTTGVDVSPKVDIKTNTKDLVDASNRMTGALEEQVKAGNEAAEKARAEGKSSAVVEKTRRAAAGKVPLESVRRITEIESARKDLEKAEKQLSDYQEAAEAYQERIEEAKTKGLDTTQLEHYRDITEKHIRETFKKIDELNETIDNIKAGKAPKAETKQNLDKLKKEVDKYLREAEINSDKITRYENDLEKAREQWINAGKPDVGPLAAKVRIAESNLEKAKEKEQKIANDYAAAQDKYDVVKEKTEQPKTRKVEKSKPIEQPEVDNEIANIDGLIELYNKDIKAYELQLNDAIKVQNQSLVRELEYEIANIQTKVDELERKKYNLQTNIANQPTTQPTTPTVQQPTTRPTDEGVAKVTKGLDEIGNRIAGIDPTNAINRVIDIIRNHQDRLSNLERNVDLAYSSERGRDSNRIAIG